jgi:hypothetical protein
MKIQINKAQQRNLDLMVQWAIDYDKAELIQTDLRKAFTEFQEYLESLMTNEKIKEAVFTAVCEAKGLK